MIKIDDHNLCHKAVDPYDFLNKQPGATIIPQSRMGMVRYSRGATGQDRLPAFLAMMVNKTV
jgi:hypothetical protein